MDKKISKMQKIITFMTDNPHYTQAEVREYFARQKIKVSSSETSLAASKLKGKESKPKKKGPASAVLKVPVAESPAMASKIKAMRKRNESLRKIIDLLLDEEVDVLLDK